MIEKLKRELLRLRGELILLALVAGIFFLVGISRGNFENMIYKLGLLAAASICVHAIRQLMFDYICVEDAIKGENDFVGIPVPMRCTVVAVMLLMYPILVYAIMVAG